MTKRIRVDKGDIFKADLGNGKVKYLQYLMLDPAMMNSEVIRVFSYVGSTDEQVDLGEVVKAEVEFYAHVVVKWGIQMELWEKAGNVPIEKDFKPPLFRDTFGHKDEFEGNQIIYKKSDSWNIWQAGSSFENRKKIGYLTEDYTHIDIGIVKSPVEIMTRMKTGEYSAPYYT